MTGVPRILWKSCKLHNSGFLSVLSCAVTFWNRALGKCAVLTGQNTKKINPKVCSELVWDGWMVLRHNSATPEPPGPWSRGRCWNVINAWELGGFAGLIPSEQGRALLGHRAVEWCCGDSLGCLTSWASLFQIRDSCSGEAENPARVAPSVTLEVSRLLS